PPVDRAGDGPDERGPVRGELQPDRLVVDLRLLPAGGRVEQAGRVIAGGGHGLAVRGERDRPDAVGVGERELEALLRGRRVEQLQGGRATAVAAADREGRAVGREGQAADGAGAEREPAQLLAGVRLPEADEV